MIFIRYEVRPKPGSELFAEVGGAFASCFVATKSKKRAKELALINFSEEGWDVVAIEDEPSPIERADYLDDPEWLEWIDYALEDGECYVFHKWPPGQQEDDPVH